jgi:hypothetical protein
MFGKLIDSICAQMIANSDGSSIVLALILFGVLFLFFAAKYLLIAWLAWTVGGAAWKHITQPKQVIITNLDRLQPQTHTTYQILVVQEPRPSDEDLCATPEYQLEPPPRPPLR